MPVSNGNKQTNNDLERKEGKCLIRVYIYYNDCINFYPLRQN